MHLRNFWLVKAKEKNLLKIVEWAQRNGLKVENLTRKEVIEALKVQR
jgi:hypothetical protein